MELNLELPTFSKASQSEKNASEFGIDGMCREMQPMSLLKRTSNSTSRNPGKFVQPSKF